MMMASHQSATVLSLVIKQVDREKHRRIVECKKIQEKNYDGDTSDDGVMLASHQHATILSLIIKQLDRQEHRRIGCLVFVCDVIVSRVVCVCVDVTCA